LQYKTKSSNITFVYGGPMAVSNAIGSFMQ